MHGMGEASSGSGQLPADDDDDEVTNLVMIQALTNIEAHKSMRSKL